MSTVRIQLPSYHPGQANIDGELRRFNVLDCGRRFGKDVYGMNKIIEPALQGYPVGWFAPTYKDLMENWRSMVHTLKPIVKTNRTEMRLDLITGGAIDMWSLDDPESGRGRKYKRIAINEAAKVKALQYSWNNVIRQTLADYQGDAFILSTPKGLNDFYILWQKAKDDPEWAHWKKPTSDNPYIAQSEIDAMKKELPDRVFRQEILAEFIEDGSYFQNIDKCAVIIEKDKPENHKGHSIVMAADWGLSGDFTILGAACRECNKVVDWDRFTGLDFTYQRERVYTMWDMWKPQGFLPERNSFGEPNIEIFMQRNIYIMRGADGKPGFNTTASTKPPLIQGLAAALEHNNFMVPEEAADELRMYEVETLLSGHQKFEAPSGSHDDWVMMLAFLWQAMTMNTWLIS